MKIDTTHTFPVTPETFWNQVYFNKEFNKTLYEKHINAESYELIEYNETPEEITRKIKVVPEQNAPKVIQKMLSGKFSYEEEGRFDKKKQVYDFKIVPSVKADKIKVTGRVTAEPAGEGSVRRTISLDLKADIFGIGGQIEKFVGGQIKKGYDESYKFTLDWIKEHNLE